MTVTYKLTDNEGNTSEITWSTVNPINGERGNIAYTPENLLDSWQYCYIPYSEQYKKFTIKIKNSDKDTDFYVALQAAGGQGGEVKKGTEYIKNGDTYYTQSEKSDDDVGAGGGGGGQIYRRKIAGGDTITIKVVLANIGDSSDSTITVNSGNTVVVGNGQDGGDANYNTTREVSGGFYPEETVAANGSDGGDGGNTTTQADLDDTNTPGYIYGGAGGNASTRFTAVKKDQGGDDGKPGTGYNSAGNGSLLESEDTADTTPPGSYNIKFEDGTFATTCSGGQAGTALYIADTTEPDNGWYYKFTDAQAGNTPWFLLYFIETIT